MSEIHTSLNKVDEFKYYITLVGESTVVDLVMIVSIQLPYIFAYTVLATPELEQHAPHANQTAYKGGEG